MPEELVKQIDAQAKTEYSSRSQLFRKLAYDYLQRMRALDEAFAYGHALGKKIGIKSDEEVAEIVHEFRHGKK